MSFLISCAIHQSKEQSLSSCQLPLTRGYIALVDLEDFNNFSHLPWFALIVNRKAPRVYAAYKPSYSKKTYLLHRTVLGIGDGLVVDHRNGNTLDCRRSNLRICTQAENTWNTRNRKLGKSGFLGVRRNASGNYFGVVRALGITHRTPTFSTSFEAARQRDALARRLHGEFVVLNFNN